MSSKTKSPEEIEREAILAKCRFSIGDKALAELLGSTFGGTGFTHNQQVLIAADHIRQFRERLRA